MNRRRQDIESAFRETIRNVHENDDFENEFRINFKFDKRLIIKIILVLLNIIVFLEPIFQTIYSLKGNVTEKDRNTLIFGFLLSLFCNFFAIYFYYTKIKEVKLDIAHKKQFSRKNIFFVLLLQLIVYAIKSIVFAFYGLGDFVKTFQDFFLSEDVEKMISKII